MTTPAPSFSSAQEYRESNRRMADSILAAEPAPYTDGGYVRRVLEVRGRVSGQTHLVPIAVISLAGSRYVVSPVRQRNWVQNLLADPFCTVRSRDTREPARATLLDDTGRVAEVVSTYIALMNAPWAVAQFPFPADAGRAQIEAAAASVAVFRLDPDN
jgi:F420H(2)-dependent quinone reductase